MDSGASPGRRSLGSSLFLRPPGPGGAGDGDTFWVLGIRDKGQGMGDR